jgi:outer membrane protein assembly factor BamB
LALIELDLAAPPGQPLSSAPPARRYRLTGLILAALLVLALGGAAPPGSLVWHYLGTVPAPAGPESPFQLDGDRAYTVAGSGTGRVVTAWALDGPPRKLWAVPFPARVVGPDQVTFGDVRVRRAGDVVLLADGPATTAVDARTGAVRWRSPIPVQALAGDRIGLVQEPEFRAGTLYDQDSGAPGPLYFSAAGEPHNEAPVRTTIRGVDLRTGATVWSAALPGSVNLFAGARLLILSSDRLTSLSPDTGAVLRDTPLPEIAGQAPSAGRLAGDVVLVSYGDDDSDQRWLVGYAAGTLQRRWQRPETKVLLNPGACDGVVCADGGSGRAVLDPVTGRPLWRAPADLDLDLRGADVLESGGGNPAVPVRLVSPVNGDQRLDLTGWRSDVSGSADQPVMLRRTLESGATAFGVVVDDPAAIQVLGTTRGPVSDCAADDRFVVCRAAGGLQVFAYRG